MHLLRRCSAPTVRLVEPQALELRRATKKKATRYFKQLGGKSQTSNSILKWARDAEAKHAKEGKGGVGKHDECKVKVKIGTEVHLYHVWFGEDGEEVVAASSAAASASAAAAQEEEDEYEDEEYEDEEYEDEEYEDEEEEHDYRDAAS